MPTPEEISSFEWMGRRMGPDPFLHDLLVEGAEQRAAQQRREELVEAAWTPEANAWNRLASISNLAELSSLTIPCMPKVNWLSREKSSPDEIIKFNQYHFRRVGYTGTLESQWVVSF